MTTTYRAITRTGEHITGMSQELTDLAEVEAAAKRIHAVSGQTATIQTRRGGVTVEERTVGASAPASILTEAARIAAAEEARFQEQYEDENRDMIAEFEAWLDERDRTRTCTHCDGTGVKEMRMSGRLHDVTAVKCPECRD